MPLPELTDLELVRLAQGGDFAAFELLVGRYERRVFTVAMRILRHQQDAEETVQQTFLTLMEKLDSFREESQFSTWLTKIAMNHALGILRKKKTRRESPLASESRDDDYADVPTPQYIAEWRETPEDVAQRREMKKLIDEALAELDEKYRLVFVLRDVEGFSTEETAEALGISVANTKVRLLRARLMLREKLTQAFGDDATRLEPHGH